MAMESDSYYEPNMPCQPMERPSGDVCKCDSMSRRRPLHATKGREVKINKAETNAQMFKGERYVTPHLTAGFLSSSKI